MDYQEWFLGVGGLHSDDHVGGVLVMDLIKVGGGLLLGFLIAYFWFIPPPPPLLHSLPEITLSILTSCPVLFARGIRCGVELCWGG